MLLNRRSELVRRSRTLGAIQGIGHFPRAHRAVSSFNRTLSFAQIRFRTQVTIHILNAFPQTSHFCPLLNVEQPHRPYPIKSVIVLFLKHLLVILRILFQTLPDKHTEAKSTSYQSINHSFILNHRLLEVEHILHVVEKP